MNYKLSSFLYYQAFHLNYHGTRSIMLQETFNFFIELSISIELLVFQPIKKRHNYGVKPAGKVTPSPIPVYLNYNLRRKINLGPGIFVFGVKIHVLMNPWLAAKYRQSCFIVPPLFKKPFGPQSSLRLHWSTALWFFYVAIELNRVTALKSF